MAPPNATARDVAHVPDRAADELRALSRLAGPIAFVQLGNTLLGAVDHAVVGRLGERALAAVGLGNTLFFTIIVLGLGVMVGLDPLVSQAIGARERTRARVLLWQSVWLAGAASLPLAGVVVAAAAWLGSGLAGLDPEVAAETSRYLLWRLPGVFPYLLFIGTRSYLQAYDVTRPMVFGVVLANVFNLAATWGLVFGDAALTGVGLPAVGLPALGVTGAAIASAGSSIVQAIVTSVACRRGAHAVAAPTRRPDPALLRRAVALGAPIAGALLAEVGSFALVTYLCGRLGPGPLAAHNVAMTWVAMTFQVPLAIGIASAVRVGRAVGADRRDGARRAGLVALGAGAAFMAAAGVAFLFAPTPLSRVMTNLPDVVAAAVPLLGVAAAFQVFDGLQVVGAGALRGLGDTRFPFLANLVGHYAVGVPLGATLAFGAGWGAEGLWWGLSAGLGVVAVALGARFVARTAPGRTLARA